MASASSDSCPLCSRALTGASEPCPGCRATPQARDAAQAINFVLRRLAELHKEGQLGEARWRDLNAYYERERTKLAQEAGTPLDAAVPPPDVCWSCGSAFTAVPDICHSCGAPMTVPAARSLRFLTFLRAEIKKQEEAGRIPPAAAHACLADTRERLAALRHKLEAQRVPAAVAATSTDDPPRKPNRQPRWEVRSLWEILLDPRSIQWLLGLGGALLVVGLVVWLAALKVFENPIVVAGCLGAGNAALLFGGWALILRTRYQTAGRALTLLACLLMPLNLWYCHYSHLVTLEGHLWVAALPICALYAASARVLRDVLFVPVLMGGVALAGLLILADLHRFEEIAAPSALLVGLGLAGIHLERAFAEGDGPFSRRRFGLAFFYSGQALLAAGLLLLLGGQLAGWLYEPLLQHWGLREAPAVFTDPALRLVAIGLVLAGTYAYVYSDLVVRRIGVYISLAVFTLLWAEVLIVQRLGLVVGEEAVIIVLAVTALLAHLLQATVRHSATTIGRAAPAFGVLLSALPVLMGVMLHIRATNREIHLAWSYDLSWGYVVAMVVTAVSCRMGAYLHRQQQPWLATCYFFGAAAATLAGFAALLHLAGLPNWDQQALIVMVVPLLYLLAARFLYRGHTAERPLIWVAQTATAFLVLGVLTASLEVTPQRFGPITYSSTNLRLALFFAEAALFYALAAGFGRDTVSAYLGAAMASGSVWQVLSYWQVDPEIYTLTFAVFGFVLLIVYRLALLERGGAEGLASTTFKIANVLLSLALVAAALLALSRLTAHVGTWAQVWLLLALTPLSLASAALVRHPAWRPWYIVAGVAEGLLMFVTLEVLSDLSIWQKAEIFSVVVGMVMLTAAHIGWYREQAPDVERQSEAVSLGLFFGSLLVGVPLAIAILSYRLPRPHEFHTPDELATLVAGVVLLGSGFLFRMRATTLCGATLLVIYVVTLLAFVHHIDELATAGMLLAIGGALVFGLGVLLSAYRDRLLALPEKIRRREGVFQVLGWR